MNLSSQRDTAVLTVGLVHTEAAVGEAAFLSAASSRLEPLSRVTSMHC